MLFRTMTWRVWVALALMIALSVSEGVGLILLIPLLGLVGLDVGEGEIGKIAAFISSLFEALGLSPTLLAVLMIFVVFSVLRSLLVRFQATFTQFLNQEFVAQLRKRLYQSIVHTPWLFFARTKSSDFTHALLTEVDRVGQATFFILRLMSEAFMGLIYLFLALRLSGGLTGLVFLCGVGLLILLKRKTYASHHTGIDVTKVSKEIYSVVHEHLGNMKMTKSYGLEEHSSNSFSRLIENMSQIYVKAIRNFADVKCWFDIGSVMTLCLVLYILIGVLRIPTTGVLLLLFLFNRLIPRFSSIQQSYQLFLGYLPAFETLSKMQYRCDAARVQRRGRSTSIGFQREIRFEQVSFSYEKEGKSLVLSGLDLSIQKGQTTAIVGATGAGKTTIADLLLGLITPQRGKILIDGEALGPEGLVFGCDKIGYVPQDTFLFHDTVRSNLLWVAGHAREEDIREALKLSVADFVWDLPQGLETIVGDRGVRLSGGERQRLALARALIRKPSLLILDEATSHLDTENERKILEGLKRFHGEMTVLIITHRLSALRGVDAIYVLEHGRIVESGSWGDLMERGGGRFSELQRAGV